MYIHMYKSLCMYARACHLQESFLYNWLLAIEHYGLSDNSESNVDVTTGRYEGLKYCHFVDVRWEFVGRDIRNQKNEQRPSHAELSSFHVFALLSPDQCVWDRHSESRGKRNMCEKDICY